MQKISVIRIVAHHDWVIFCLLACLLAYVFMLIVLQRDASVTDFVMQNYADSSNQFSSWVIVGIVSTVSTVVLLSQYVPIVPKTFSVHNFLGFQVNKVGYTLLVLVGYYIVKNLGTYFFFSSVGHTKNWMIFYFNATKFYFITSILFMILGFVHYYYPIDERQAFLYYIFLYAIILVAKISFYLFSKNPILPKQLYYKILYICTLQIIPVLVLWRLLFFN